MPLKRKCCRPSSTGILCCKKIAAGIRELVAKVGKKKWQYTPPAVNKALYASIETQIRTELTDALDTKKYPKLESYHRVHEAKKKVVEALPEEQQAEAKELFDSLKERIFRDEMLKAKRRPDGRAFDEIRNIDCEVGVLPRTHGSALVHARRDAGAGHRHARHQGRRTAHRDVRSYRNLQALHVALQLPAVQRRRSGIHARSGTPRNRAWRAGGTIPFGRCSGRQKVPLHHARGQRHSGIERFQFHGQRVWRRVSR